MITKKTKKINSNGYNLRDIPTPTTTQKQVKNSVNDFFNLLGLTVGTGVLISVCVMILLPIMAEAKQGIYIIEPFSCDTETKNYYELKRVLALDIPDFQREMQELDLNLTTQSLIENNCKGFENE